MKINLEELTHQRKALDAIIQNFGDLADGARNDDTANPLLKNAFDEKKFIDIKMETGTGKTYVYTRAMFELYEKYGIFKFIIVVPSLAIKEGTKNFIESDYAFEHFSRFFPNVKIELETINRGDWSSKKGKRKTIPVQLSQFCEASKYTKNTIECLLLSDKGFLDRNDSSLFKNDYDQTLYGGYNCPVDAIKSTLPVLIIDEPHRIKRDGNTYKNIIEKIQPQMILRFGATFPEKNGTVDYFGDTPQYNLCSVDAFNQDLVKGVSVNYAENADSTERYRVKSATKNALMLTRKSDKKEFTINSGDSLSDVSAKFEGGVTYDGASKKLSNELSLCEGMELVDGVFSNSYQELMMGLALERHFEAEETNFLRHQNGEGWKIKTICLFFIDSIESYREDGGWLKTTFERLLKNHLEAMAKKHKNDEYGDFLRASLKNISLCHGGYFAKDWGEADDSAIAEEVGDILHKERTLSFKKSNRDWNTRRFFFSKWTLREGWDNPNVFTICKLRSSGSETSKIQEVGRGLRLPVDEVGNRLQNNKWFLNFVIGSDESEFAKKLVGEINAGAKVILNAERVTDEMIKFICDARKISEDDLCDTLVEKGIMKASHKFADGGYEKLIAEFPELKRNQVVAGKVKNATDKTPVIKLKKENWEKIREFWNVVSKRYMISLDKNTFGEEEIEKMFSALISDERSDDVFSSNVYVKVQKQTTARTESGGLILRESAGTVENSNFIGQMKYNDFVKKISVSTCVPLKIVHKCLWQKFQAMQKSGTTVDTINKMINTKTLENIIARWNKIFDEQEMQYEYNSLDFSASVSVMKNGVFVDSLPRGDVGEFQANDVEVTAKNLYDAPLAYDSEKPEHDILKIDCENDKIKVFGKLPRRAIKVPKITGGTTTPDFIYAIETENGKTLYMLLEAKSDDMRSGEMKAVQTQQNFFKMISDNTNLQAECYVVHSQGEVMELLKSS